MTFERLFKGISSASLLIFFSGAVLSCTLAEGVSADQVEAEHLAYLRALHWPAIVLGVGTIVIFFLRRFKGIVILLLAASALAISPGWYASSAAIDPACGPVGGFGTKVVLSVVAICFLIQLTLWSVERLRIRWPS
ncbi:MAG: hypothetical protein DYH05_08985 [Acidobacteria bacterium ACB1]|nr:hypothetical protein [Pyrinomonadaceae bacterium]MCE7962615.1 hypothetical protein [Acidobacteria bacterium ACB1]RIJ95008.1 MAG: hypothetical protein DCC44_02940 [Acidobacteriota bacterium]